MNSKGSALLVDPHPCGHIVYPYTDEGLVGQAVCLFASSGIRANEGVVLIMSSDHCGPIKLRLQLEGINVEAHERSGQLICVTTEGLLATFMRNGSLDEEMFRSAIRDMIRRVRRGEDAPHSRVRVFGEMVSQLRNTDIAATTRLEELWDEVIKEHSVALLCTYALQNADDQLPDHLINLHSHNIQRELAVP
jgi:MEDS: MEthanogen/methylotroph, DcmR Sensory domain